MNHNSEIIRACYKCDRQFEDRASEAKKPATIGSVALLFRFLHLRPTLPECVYLTFGPDEIAQSIADTKAKCRRIRGPFAYEMKHYID